MAGLKGGPSPLAVIAESNAHGKEEEDAARFVAGEA